MQLRGVAQLGSALRSGRRGRRFKSCHPDHIKPGQSGLARPGLRPKRGVQQRSTAVGRSPERLPQPAQGLLSRLRAGPGVDLHRHRLVGMAENPHDDPRVHVKINEERRTGSPGVMHCQPPHVCGITTSSKPPVQRAWIDRGPVAAGEDRSGPASAACQASPASERLLSCSSRRITNAVATISGIGRVASDASVLVSR